MKQKRQQRGFILQTVIGAIVILVVGGTFLYMRTHEHLMMTGAVRLQTIAASRATLGVETAIAQLKQQVPSSVTTLAPCHISETLAACTPGRVASLLDLDNGTGVDLSAGGGRQYHVNVFLRTNDAGLQSRLLLVSDGFYGYRYAGVDSPNLISSQLQVELSMPISGTGGSIVTGYSGGG